MKTIHLIILVGLFFTAHHSMAAGCAGTPVPAPPPVPSQAGDTVVPKCALVSDAIAAAATPQIAQSIEEQFAALGKEGLRKHCVPKSPHNLEIYSNLSGTLCGKDKKAPQQRICHYIIDVTCNFQDKEFRLNVAGACVGEAESCGTYEACIKDDSLTTKITKFSLPSGKSGDGAGQEAKGKRETK
ncbi:MAG: hypothetical protein JNL11_15430 [Bdellovibrionaceae bacterium]|nr:hypothetical protein [Pseudobdellovibrionaceae bacterium]